MDPSVFVGPVMKEFFALAKSRLAKKLDKSAPSWTPIFDRMEEYLGGVLRWSSRIQFFGMSEAEDTDYATVGLRFGFEPRRFRGMGSTGITIGEPDLLTDINHYVILGDPGSGKTTTLKRLARAVMVNEAISSTDIYRYPVVLLLREHVAATDPERIVADVLGIPYEVLQDRVGPGFCVSGKEPLFDVIVRFLNASNAIMMLDGLDELPERTRRLFEKWAVKLSYRLEGSKIIITARSGDYYRHLDGFNVLELCPLAPDQARQIAERWLHNPDEFLQTLRDLPYHDVADRPLLLTQLIILFRREGALPEQPSHVYRRLLRLLLEDWDKERGINRSTRYAGFDPDRKADFLAALSYRLTYRVNNTWFTIQDLTSVYKRLHHLFGLPQSEAAQVAEEIASHSGLINASGSGYEFSHMSFQEYLCACHLVREPFPEHLEQYVADRPGPLAVAVAISSSPANWFAGLILKEIPFRAFSRESFRSFLSRLQLERPMFDISIELGIAAMLLFYESASDSNLREAIRFLFQDASVLDSMGRALRFYVVPWDEQARAGEFLLRASLKPTGRFSFEMPETVSLPEHTLVEILKRRDIPVAVVGGEEMHLLRLDEKGGLTRTRIE